LEVQGTLHRIANSAEGRTDARTAAAATAEKLLESVRELEEAADKNIDYDPTDLIMTLRKQINSLDTEIIGINRDLYDVET
jgi:uncharacterized protein involved in exopolysaccharide biosynthesis